MRNSVITSANNQPLSVKVERTLEMNRISIIINVSLQTASMHHSYYVFAKILRTEKFITAEMITSNLI